MTYPLIIINKLQPQPNGFGWIFTREWHAVDHPQSGSEHHLPVCPYVIVSAQAAWAEVSRNGLPEEADRVILQQWENPTGVLQ